MKKRLICLLLAIGLLVCQLPLGVLAADEQEETAHWFHTLRLENVKEATAAEPGYTGDVVCSECGKVFMTGIQIPAIGETEPEETLPQETAPEETEHKHSYGIINAKEATAAEPGYTGDLGCTECGEILIPGFEIPATGKEESEETVPEETEPEETVPEETEHKHSYGIINAKEATAAQPGYTGDLGCTECGEVFIPGFEIPATGKEEPEETVPEETVPEETEPEETVPEETEHKHSYGIINAKEATAAQPGYTGDLGCTECGEVFIPGFEIPATGKEDPEEPVHTHKPRLEGSRLPDYLNPGYTGDTVCADCGEILQQGVEIPATGSGSSLLPNPFDDVSPTAYYYESVLWAYYGGITKGRTDTTFEPDAPCTRAQVVTFLWRAAGYPEPETEENPFDDVQEDAYYYKAVLWALEQGITLGVTEDEFQPSRTCTRSEFVTFLWRYRGQPQAGDEAQSFPDVEDGKYYTDAVAWAAVEGITLGYIDGTFRPAKTCTRAEVVTFLRRSYP